MVCFDDHSRLISLQSMFTLLFIPVVSLWRYGRGRRIVYFDWFAKILFSLKLTFLLRAIIDSLSVDAWPSNVGAQLLFILSFTIYFLTFIRMLTTSALETCVMIASFFFGISLLGPVWQTFQEIVTEIWYHLFGYIPSDTEIAIAGVVFVTCVLIVVLAVHWKGWIHTLIMSVLVTLDVMLSFHLLIYNTDWSSDADWMSSHICCTMPEVTDMSDAFSDDKCPLRLTRIDLAVLILMGVAFIPMQFYVREQCLPLWICCRHRARALAAYRKQKFKPMYGQKLKAGDSDHSDCDEDDDDDGGGGASHSAVEPTAAATSALYSLIPTHTTYSSNSSRSFASTSPIYDLRLASTSWLTPTQETK